MDSTVPREKSTGLGRKAEVPNLVELDSSHVYEVSRSASFGAAAPPTGAIHGCDTPHPLQLAFTFALPIYNPHLPTGQ
jgi:hypothetical protein